MDVPALVMQRRPHAIAFLDRYVKDAPEALTLLDAQPGVSTFLHN